MKTQYKKEYEDEDYLANDLTNFSNPKPDQDDTKQVLNLQLKQKAIELDVQNPKINFKEMNLDKKVSVKPELKRILTRQPSVSNN